MREINMWKTEDFDEMLNSFENSYNQLQEQADKIENLYWVMEKEGITLKLVTTISDFLNSLNNDLKNIFTAEEILYKEMMHFMPEQSSINAFKSENESILKLLDSLIFIINDKQNIKKKKDLMQAEMIVIADIIRRDVSKKTSIFLHEARTVIPEENLNEIKQKLTYSFAQ